MGLLYLYLYFFRFFLSRVCPDIEDDDGQAYPFKVTSDLTLNGFGSEENNYLRCNNLEIDQTKAISCSRSRKRPSTVTERRY
jgi:hypothetical protein